MYLEIFEGGDRVHGRFFSFYRRRHRDRGHGFRASRPENLLSTNYFSYFAWRRYCAACPRASCACAAYPPCLAAVFYRLATKIQFLSAVIHCAGHRIQLASHAMPLPSKVRNVICTWQIFEGERGEGEGEGPCPRSILGQGKQRRGGRGIRQRAWGVDRRAA